MRAVVRHAVPYNHPVPDNLHRSGEATRIRRSTRIRTTHLGHPARFRARPRGRHPRGRSQKGKKSLVLCFPGRGDLVLWALSGVAGNVVSRTFVPNPAPGEALIKFTHRPIPPLGGSLRPGPPHRAYFFRGSLGFVCRRNRTSRAIPVLVCRVICYSKSLARREFAQAPDQSGFHSACDSERRNGKCSKSKAFGRLHRSA